MLDRRQAVAELLKDRPDNLLIVTGLGSPTYDAAAAGDDPRNFHLWGAMGGAVPMGLGLALARPGDRVLAITGDGEMLMGLGALATCGARPCRNLAVAVIDNEAYGETGGQTSHTGLGADLSAIALACGFAAAATVREAAGLADLRRMLLSAPGPVLGVVKAARGDHARVLPARDGHHLRHRFKQALPAG